MLVSSIVLEVERTNVGGIIVAILCITKFVDCESISPTQRATHCVDCLVCIWVEASREGVENGHVWGMGPKRCR